MKKDTIIISLGGSLVAPEGIDVEFLKKIKNVLEKYIKKATLFVLVGGGKTARKYQAALAEFGADASELDWAGIDATRMNARIVKQVFAENAYKEIIIDPTKKTKTSKPIIVAAGYKPGWSTDYCATLIAKSYKAKTIINLSNIDYVYDKDPKKFPDAKPLEDVSWVNFEKIVGSKWTPGLNIPFDPVASKLAAKLGLKVVMLNGHKLENLENFLNNKQFTGTVIE